MGQVAHGEVLTLDGIRFARWRGERPPVSPNRLSTKASLIGAAVALAAYLVLAALALTVLSSPKFRDFFGQALVMVPIIVCSLVAIAGEAQFGRPKAKPVPPKQAEDAPQEAIPVKTTVGGLGELGDSRGRLFGDGGRLRFRGERFDFDLRVSDLRKAKNAVKKLGTGRDVALAVPDGFCLPFALEVAKEKRAELGQLLERWAAQPEPDGDSLLPPIEHESPAPSAMEYLRELAAMAPIAGACALGMASFILLAPKGLLPGHVTWNAGTVCGFSLAMFTALPGVFAIASIGRRHRRIQERLSDGRPDSDDDSWTPL